MRLPITSAVRYYSPKERRLNSRQRHIRLVAKSLKRGTQWAIEEAALAIAGAELIPAGAVLVPIPGSAGGLEANTALAKRIAEITGATVKRLVRRTRHLPSQMMMRRMGRAGTPAIVQANSMTASARIPKRTMLVLIDNIVVTGATMYGAWIAMGMPKNIIGIAYARGKEVIY